MKRSPALAVERPAQLAGELAGTELIRLARSDKRAAKAALAALSNEQLARACQDLRLELRDEFLMLVEHPEDIVPLLPEAELVQTVRAGGMSEAAWLLELATPEQRIAAFDLDCWTGSELQVTRVHEWLDALIEAGRPTLVKALEEMDLEVLLLAMHAETEVAVVSKEQVPPIGYFTPDGVVYFGTAPDASPHRDAFFRGLRDLGYVPGQNIMVDVRRYASEDRKSTRLNSSHYSPSRMPSSA